LSNPNIGQIVVMRYCFIEQFLRMFRQVFYYFSVTPELKERNPSYGGDDYSSPKPGGVAGYDTMYHIV